MNSKDRDALPVNAKKFFLNLITGIVDQTKESSLMHRYGTLDEQVAPILFLASDESSYITGTVLPVGGGDLG